MIALVSHKRIPRTFVEYACRTTTGPSHVLVQAVPKCTLHAKNGSRNQYSCLCLLVHVGGFVVQRNSRLREVISFTDLAEYRP